MTIWLTLLYGFKRLRRPQLSEQRQNQTEAYAAANDGRSEVGEKCKNMEGSQGERMPSIKRLIPRGDIAARLDLTLKHLSGVPRQRLTRHKRFHSRSRHHRWARWPVPHMRLKQSKTQLLK